MWQRQCCPGGVRKLCDCQILLQGQLQTVPHFCRISRSLVLGKSNNASSCFQRPDTGASTGQELSDGPRPSVSRAANLSQRPSAGNLPFVFTFPMRSSGLDYSVQQTLHVGGVFQLLTSAEPLPAREGVQDIYAFAHLSLSKADALSHAHL